MKKTDEEVRSRQEEKLCGGDSEKDTPVPMPNTAVKLFSAESSWGFPPVRVGRCHAKDSIEKRTIEK